MKKLRSFRQELERCGFSCHGFYRWLKDIEIYSHIDIDSEELPKIIRLQANIGSIRLEIDFTKDVLDDKQMRNEIIIELFQQAIKLLEQTNEKDNEQLKSVKGMPGIGGY